MASDLIIGPLDSDFQDHVLRICQRLGLRGWPSTGNPIDLNRRIIGSGPQRTVESAMISVLNDASLDAFNTFAAGLEGFSGNDAITKTALRNLPWWLQSVWMPIEFDPPSDLASDEGDPTFVGSSIRLARELTTIKTMSSLDFGAIPSSYMEMRKNYRSWFRATLDHRNPLSQDETIRWIWNALSEAAQMSIESKVPVALYP
jgi:hypothetical protein